MILRIMIAIIVLITIMVIARPTIDNIETATNTSVNLNCSATSLSVETQATCIVLQLAVFYFIGTLVCIGMAYLAGSKNINGIISAITIFIIVNILIQPLKTFLVYLRDVDHLACETATWIPIKMTCILTDLWLIWFVIVALSGAVSYIFIKKVINKE